MTRPGGAETDVEAAVRHHACRILAGDAGEAGADAAPHAELRPADLLEGLCAGGFREFELVAHARIGVHHVYKTRFVGPTVVVVQARWAQDPEGRWRLRDAEVARTETPPASDADPG